MNVKLYINMSKNMKKFEYLKGLVDLHKTIDLNELGLQGWELVSVVNFNPIGTIYIFKREIFNDNVG